jgi:hypothetical protein
MSNMANLQLDIFDEVARGQLSFQEIATKYDVPLSWVDESCKMMQGFDNHDSYEEDCSYDN